MTLTPEFTVVEGHGAYEIVDRAGIVVGREPSRERIDSFCQSLNAKWTRLMDEFCELSRSLAKGTDPE